jgi:hypothetical protein
MRLLQSDDMAFTIPEKVAQGLNGFRLDHKMEQ